MTLHYNEHDYSADKLTYRGEICGTVVEYNFTSFNSYSCDFLQSPDKKEFLKACKESVYRAGLS